MFSSTLKIDTKKIGLDQQTYFFVDNAANHDGDLERDKFELLCDLKEVLKSIELLGITLLLEIINKGFQPIPNNSVASRKRRKPEDSEITLEQIKNNSSLYLHSKIRIINNVSTYTF